MSRIFKIALFVSSFGAGPLCATGENDPQSASGGQDHAQAAQNQQRQTHRSYAHTQPSMPPLSPQGQQMQSHVTNIQGKIYDSDGEEPKKGMSTKKKAALVGVGAAAGIAAMKSGLLDKFLGTGTAENTEAADAG